MGTSHDDDDWSTYRRGVVENQTLFRDGLERLTERVGKLEIQFARTAAVYGLGSGAVTVAIAELIKHAFK